MTKKKKKIVLWSILAGVLVVGGVLAIRGYLSPQSGLGGSKKRRLSLPTNIIEIAERPYLVIKPLADGRNLEISILNLKKDAKEMDYELEYQAGTLLQGAFGNIDLAKIPATAKILLGSCSAGGACTFHEDVQGGSLLTRYIGGEDDYALKSDWKYIDNAKRGSEFSSKDAKFQIDSKDLTRQRFLVIFNTPGLPEGLESTPVSEPYSLATSGVLKGDADLTMRAMEEGELKIAGYDADTEEWTIFEGEVEGKMIVAEVELMDLYVVVK